MYEVEAIYLENVAARGRCVFKRVGKACKFCSFILLSVSTIGRAGSGQVPVRMKCLLLTLKLHNVAGRSNGRLYNTPTP